MTASQYAKENDLPLKEVLEQFGLTHHAQSVPETGDKQVELPQPDDVVPVAPKKAKKAEKVINTVTFYWRDGKNITFTIKGAVVGGIQNSGLFYKSEKSVIRLNKGEDQKAIDYLRAHKANEANGGREFGEFDQATISDGGSGTMLDKLMGMDKGALVAMLGGSITDSYKTKGTLISEIMSLNV